MYSSWFRHRDEGLQVLQAFDETSLHFSGRHSGRDLTERSLSTSKLREDEPPLITATSPRKNEQATSSDHLSPEVSTHTPDLVYASHDTPTSPTGSDAIAQLEPLPDIPTLSLPAPAPDPPRRSERVRRFPKHLQDYAAHVQLQSSTPEDSTDFLTFQQAQTNPHWQTAMEEEIESIHKNQTWSLVSLPPNTKAISSKWVYKLKPGTRDSPAWYKGRLVARGFEQRDGVEYLETFAPVVRWETIRILVAIAVHLGWPIHQLDVLTAFLNGILKEDVSMNQPPGFVKPGSEHLVCKLRRSLYSLKQSPRAWYARLHAVLLAWKLTQSTSDPNLYFAHIVKDTIALLVYVDDILLTGSNSHLIAQLKHHLHRIFNTKDLGPIRRRSI